MARRTWSAVARLTGAIGLAALSLGCGGPSDLFRDDEEARRPNVVVIFVDDLGYGDLGIQGSPDIRTPRIDSIAHRGVQCTAGYVTAPQCSPSRAGILTGQYQQRFGHEANPEPEFRDSFGLPTGVSTFAERLQQVGYHTAGVGKWDLGRVEFAHPWNRGFEDYYGFLVGARTYWPVNRGAMFQRLTRGPTEDDYVEEREYLTDQLTDGAVGLIRTYAYSDRPFGLYVSYNAPHVPFQAPAEHLARNSHIEDPDRRLYAAMITAVDDGVGRILDELEAQDLLDDTLLFFISDNGAPRSHDGNHTVHSNEPWRGVKGQLYDGGIRVPFLVQWPGRLPQGVVYDRPVSSLDVAATALAVAGAQASTGLDGVDLLPYLDGSESDDPHEALYWRWMGWKGVRYGDWKWVQPPDEPAALYDLSRDALEAEDRRAQWPELADELRSAWQRWNEKLVAPRWRTSRQTRQLADAYGPGSAPAVAP